MLERLNKRLALSIVLGMGALATVSLAVAAYMQRLPAPEETDRRGLFRWLIETDLAQQPRDVQLRLLTRVEEELLAGIDFRSGLSQIDATQRGRLLANVDRLAEIWFLREADRFYAEPEAARPDVLDRQARQIRRLGILEQMSALEGHDTAQAVDHVAAVAEHARRVDRWIEQAPAAERERLTTYFSALRGRLLWDSFQNWLTPAPKS